MGEIVNLLNTAGGVFVTWAGRMLIQSSVLIALLAVLDLVLRKRVRAVVRYWIWLLVLAKLILPPSFSSPTSLAYWVGGKLSSVPHAASTTPVARAPLVSLPPVGESIVPSSPRTPNADPPARHASEEPPLPRVERLAPASPVVSSHTGITWQALALLAWAAVVVVMAVLLIQRALFVHGLVAQSREAPQEIVELLHECRRRLGARTNLAVRLSPLAASPSVCGLWRPIILIPEEMRVQLQGHELRSVLLHELAHVKRGDLWVNLIQALLQVVYFYHPFLWAANARIRKVREQAVDETVLAALGEEAEDYPRTLLSVSRLAFGQPMLSLRLLGAVESKRALADRIRHMAGRPFPQSAKLGCAGLLLVLIVGVALLPMARAGSATSLADEPETAIAALEVAAGSSNSFTGDFVLDREIPVGLVAGTPGHPRLVEIPWIRIEATYGNGWCATARVGWSPTVDSTWRIRLELLDSQGRLLRHARDRATEGPGRRRPAFRRRLLRHARDRATVFTGQADAGVRGMRYAELELAPLSWDATGRRGAAKIRLSLEPVTDPTVDPATSYSLVMVVLDGKDQRPIPEATVISTTHYRDAPLRGPVSFRSTDARGECRIVVSKAGVTAVAVTVQKDGYATMSTSWSNYSSWPFSEAPLLDLPERHVVELVPAQTIGGVVRDEQGRPIAGVQVMVETHLQEVGGTAYFRHNVLTDPDGRWRIGGIAAGVDRLQLGFRHPEYAGDYFASRQLTPEQLSAARASEYAAVLHQGLAVGGVVLNAQGRPVPNAVVILAPRRNGRFCDEYAYTRTEAAGRFRFDCALDDRKDTMDDGGATGIFVDVPGYVPTLQRVVVEPNLAPLELRLRAGRTVTVRVVGPDGRPLAGAWTAVDPFTENREYGLWQEDTDEQGRVQIGDVGENGVRLTVGKSGYITLRNHVLHASEQDRVVTLKPAPRVQGTVVDAETGQPIPNFDVAPVRDGRLYSYSASHFRDGRFELSFNEAESKTLQLKISAVGYRPTTSGPISLEEPRVLAFKLAQDPSFRGDPAERGRAGPPSDEPSAIKGVVQDPNGRPVAEATVVACPWLGLPTTTDAEGKFKLRWEGGRTSSGDRETPCVIVRDKKHNLAAVVELDRLTAQDLTIKLAPAVILSGRVTDAQGKGLSSARLVLYFWRANTGHPLSEEAKPDADGSYEIRAVPPDYRYSVDVTAEGYGQENVEVPLAEAVNDRVALAPAALQVANLDLSGMVVDAEDQPVSGARVFFYGRGQPHRDVRSDAKGRFVVHGLCAGTIQIQANTMGTTNLHGFAQAQGGATDIKIVVSPMDSRGRPVPPQPRSLVGKPLPSLPDLGLDPSSAAYQDKPLLLCFFDVGQRPSRHCLETLAQQADVLAKKGVAVIAVQAADADAGATARWVKEQSIPWPIQTITGDATKQRLAWGVASLPWLILTDARHLVRAAGFELSELENKLEAVRRTGAVVVSARASAPATAAGPSGTDRITLTGQVTDPQGKLVEGAEVTFYLETAGELGVLPIITVLDRKTTGADGAFTFAAPKTAKDFRFGHVIARKAGLALIWADWPMREDQRLDLRLPGEPKELAGDVVDEAGRPIADAVVHIAMAKIGKGENRHDLRSTGFLRTKTGRNGHFVFADMPAAATFEFLVEAAGRGPVGTVDITSHAREQCQFAPGQAGIRFTLPVEARIEGVVVEKIGGKPVGGIEVAAHSDRRGRGAPVPSQRAVTAPDGTFRLGNLSDGPCTVELWVARGQKPEWVAEDVRTSLTAGQTKGDIRMEITKGAFIEALIKDTAGKPVEKVGVYFRRVGQEQGFGAPTDANGLTRIRVLPGAYSVSQIFRPGYTPPETMEQVTVAEGETKRIEYAVTPARRVTGIVRDEAGNPLAGVKVQATWIKMLAAITGGAVSDASGKFDFPWDTSLPGRAVTAVIFVAQDSARNLVQALDIDEDTGPLDLKLRPGVIVTGTVLNQAGRPLPGATARVLVRVARIPVRLSWDELATAGPEGVFEFKAVPPEREYEVEVTADGYGKQRISIASLGPQEKRHDIGQVKLAASDLSVSGIVVDPNDEPVAGVEVSAYGEGQPDLRSVQTDTQGRFTIKGVCPGSIRLMVNPRGPSRLYGSTQAEAGATEVRIAVAERRLPQAYAPRRGAVLKGKPLPPLRDLGIALPAEAEGKILLVCFWDMGQRPSRSCLTQLAAQATALRQKGVEIVTVHAAPVESGILRQWLEENKVPFQAGIIAGDINKTKSAWGVASLPHLILTDKKHVVIAEGFGLNELDKQVEAMIGQ